MSEQRINLDNPWGDSLDEWLNCVMESYRDWAQWFICETSPRIEAELAELEELIAEIRAAFERLRAQDA